LEGGVTRIFSLTSKLFSSDKEMPLLRFGTLYRHKKYQKDEDIFGDCEN
jgi:hypothetical protein